MKKNCTLLVGSCDNYSDLWDPFFELLHRFWPNLDYDIVLSTESSKYKSKYHNIININPSSKNLSWSTRMAETLKKIKTDYVILMLDDFFLKDKVDNLRVEETLTWLKENENIATFTYWPIASDGEVSKFSGFEKRPDVAQYKVAAILGIWNKKKLLKYLEGYEENAWQWEYNATERANTIYQKDEFYVTSSNENQIFPYDFTSEGLFSGKWFKQTVPLFKKLKINIDYSKRGFYDEAVRGLSPSIISSFEMNSYMIPYYELKNKNKGYLENKNKIKNGKFLQEYKIKNSFNMLRWEPAVQWGFLIKNLEIKVKYMNGDVEIIDGNELFGSFLKQKNSYYFNKANPFMYIPTKKNKLMKLVEITGELVFPITEKDLKKSYNYETMPKSQESKELYQLMWIQFLSIPEKTYHIKLNSEWTMVSNKKTKKIKSKNTIKKGYFREELILDNRIEFVEWLPSRSGGYAIKKLKFYFKKNNSLIRINSKNISNIPYSINNHYMFLSDDKIEIIIPDEEITEIVITGEFICPVPTRIMRKAVYENNGIIKKIRDISKKTIIVTINAIKKISKQEK